MKRYTVFLAFILALITVSCKKAPDAPSGSSELGISAANTDTVKATWVVAASSITKEGLGNLANHGFCWDTKPVPDISSPHNSMGRVTVPGPFTAKIQSLKPLTKYYLRSYIIDDKYDFLYSDVIEFTTPELALPSVTTDPVSIISSTSVQCGGVITSDGNGKISARGVCWVISGTPSLGHHDGLTADQGEHFVSYVSELLPDTTYQIVAYATNEQGSSYGAIRSFSTRLPCGEATVDYGGTTYHSVQIGDQCWMKENLNIGTRVNGTQNQDPLNPTIEKYCFNDDEANCTLYGGLYQWDEMMQSSLAPGTRGICPAGWHLPSDGDWSLLTGFLGGESMAGTKMKSASGWYNNGDGTNSSGFTGLPGGNRGNDGVFNNLTQLGYFWSSSEAGASEAWNRKLNFDSDGVTRYNSFKTNGFSVRCVRE